ncbi:MAG: hypothetical protein ABIO06_10205 [Pseudolysinimonas sp.]
MTPNHTGTLPLVLEAASGILFVIYFAGVLETKTWSRRHLTATDVIPGQYKALRREVGEVFGRLVARSSREVEGALLFYELLVTPQKRIERITENVQPMSRSMLVRTSTTYAVPTTVPSGPLIFPVMMQRKGVLEHGLRLYRHDGSRVPTLSERSSIVYSAAYIRFYIWSAGSDAYLAYLGNLEKEVLALITEIAVEERAAKLDRVEKRILKLPSDPGNKPLLSMAIRAIRRLASRFLIAVIVNYVRPEPGIPRSSQIRLTAERRVIAQIVRHRPKPRGSGMRREQLLRWARGVFGRLMDRIRLSFGVTPTVIQFVLENADRAATYHLEITGPPGTYLAEQSLIDDDGDPTDLPPNTALQARLGQRHSHLYVRQGTDFVSRFLVNNFYERTPGSMARASLVALSAATIVWICAVIKLQWIPTHVQSTDLVAVLLAFPAVAAAWSGIDQAAALRGGVLVAKVSSFVTLILALAASALYIVDPSGTPAEQHLKTVLWTLILAGVSLNLVATIGSWRLRAGIQRRLISRVELGDRW